MMQCPQCAKEWTLEEQRCQHCGFVWETSLPADFDPYKTLSWKQLIDSLKPGESTTVKSEVGYSTELGPDNRSKSNDPDGTVIPESLTPEFDPNATVVTDSNARESSSPETSTIFPENDEEGFLISADETDNVLLDSDAGATIDVGHKTESPAADQTVDLTPPDVSSDHGTVGSGDFQLRTDATVDADSLDKEKSDAASTSDSDFTLDSNFESSTSNTDSARAASSSGRVSQIWAGMIQSNATPSHAIRNEGRASDSVFDRVAMRSISEHIPGRNETPDYRIIRKVGEGAMGVVYSARQKAIGRVVALKAIKPSHQANEESRRKFFYEAQITGDLDHPNIVPIHELGASQDGMLFYSMKLIGGTEWKEVIKSKSLDENLEILLKVCDAIAFAHSKNVIHRDLKPENTMLGTYGEVFVTDWGLAVNLDTETEFSLGGTPVYMAPEMAAHNVSKIGPRSDIYILGGILFQIITGRGPHPGRSVTECLRAAIRNHFHPHPEKNPLLDIAMKAMSKNPEDRYATVEEFQDAIRGYRRHAESIAIATRSRELLLSAIDGKVYEQFSRAMFGFQDAIALWPENIDAADGLAKARFAYAQCAFDRADYDLCLGIVDRESPEEDALYRAAADAKKQIFERESRLKNLRKVLVATIATALVGMSGLTLYAMVKRSQAVEQTRLAEQARNVAETAKAQEEVARQAAVDEKELAIAAQMAAEQARLVAEQAKAKEEIAKQAAIASQKETEQAKLDAERDRDLAVVAKREAEEAQQAESIAKQEAFQRAAEVELGNYQSTLALAKAQVDQFDIAAGRRSLDSIKELASPIFASKQQTPRLDSWAWRRISLLSNAHLPRWSFGSDISAAAFHPTNHLAAIGTIAGELSIIDLNRRSVDSNTNQSRVSRLQTKYPIEAITFIDGGESVVFAQRSAGLSPTVFLWNGKSNDETRPISALGQRSIQSLSVSPDGQQLVAGINAGLWIWDLKQTNWFDQPPIRRIEDVRGEANNLVWIDNDQIFVVSKLGDRLYGFIARSLSTAATTELAIPEEIATRVSAAAYEKRNDCIILGLNDGRLFSWKPDAAAKQAFHEILPQKHSTPIESIVVHADGSVLTTSREPVVQVWRSEKSVTSGWVYDTFLAGTSGNAKKSYFVDNSQTVLGFDSTGDCLIWDIDEQKQMRVGNRFRSESNETETYPKPLVNTFVEANGLGVSIDENGVLDRWQLANGRTDEFDGDRWLFAGHTPNATLTDVAWEPDANLAVTSASLRTATTYDSSGPKSLNEICLWDLRTRGMLRRWTNDAAVEQRISLCNNGKSLILANDDVTEIRSLPDNRLLFEQKDFGTYLAVSHPIRSQSAILVKRSGAARMLDLSDPSSWLDKRSQEFSLADNTDVPHSGVWTADGERFYLLFGSGKLAIFRWDGTNLKVLDVVSTVRDDSGSQRAIDEVVLVQKRKLRHPWDAELLISSEKNRDVVSIAVRSIGSPSRTRLTQIAFEDDETPQIIRQMDDKGLLQVDLSSPSGPNLVPVQASFGSIRNSKLLGMKSSKASSAFLFSNGLASLTTSESNEPILVGRDRLTQSLLHPIEKSVWTVHESGSIWEYTPFAETTRNANSIRLPQVQGRRLQFSNDGSLLLLAPDSSSTSRHGVDAPNQANIVRLSDRIVTRSIDDVANAAWIRGFEDRLAWVTSRGEVKVTTVSGTDDERPLATLPWTPDTRVVAIETLVERWQESEKGETRWLAIQLESGVASELVFVRLVENPDQSSPSAGNTRRITIQPKSRLAFSPTDNVFAIAQNGIISLWMGLPSLEAPRPLYNLDGHRGAEVTSLSFTDDGNSVISTDSQNRLLIWRSEVRIRN